MTFNTLLSRKWFCWQDLTNSPPKYIIDPECTHSSFLPPPRKRGSVPFHENSLLQGGPPAPSPPPGSHPSVNPFLPSLTPSFSPLAWLLSLLTANTHGFPPKKPLSTKESWGVGDLTVLHLDSGGGYAAVCTVKAPRTEHQKGRCYCT